MNVYAERTEKPASQKNQTGIPYRMKAGFEHSSGFSFDDVRVHYNSEKPAQLHAHAYTQGNEVYVAPGQEKHLPHELGHVVQQKKNEVKPTGEIGGLPLNDDEAMEYNADLIAKDVKNTVDLGEEPVQAKSKEGGIVQKADSGDAYNWSAGVASTVLAGLGMIGGGIGFFASKSKDRKRLYDEEIDKYADAACEAHEEYIQARDNANPDNGGQINVNGEMKKLAARVKRNYETAIKKAIKYGALQYENDFNGEQEQGKYGIGGRIHRAISSSTRSTQDNDVYNAQNLTNDKINRIKELNVRNALSRAKNAYDESSEALNQNGQQPEQPNAQQQLEQPNAQQQPDQEDDNADVAD